MPVDDGRCFVCGPDNAAGLQLKFERTGEGAVAARTSLRQEFQGWRGIAHGGIAMALLDEAMAHAAGAAGYRGLTGSITARFRKPVPLGVPLSIEGRLKWRRRNVLGLQARLSTQDGTLLIEGEGSFVAYEHAWTGSG